MPFTIARMVQDVPETVTPAGPFVVVPSLRNSGMCPSVKVPSVYWILIPLVAP